MSYCKERHGGGVRGIDSSGGTQEAGDKKLLWYTPKTEVTIPQIEGFLNKDPKDNRRDRLCPQVKELLLYLNVRYCLMQKILLMLQGSYKYLQKWAGEVALVSAVLPLTS